ncbi:hypothetical protein D3C86_1852120 [compost metagenome]
MVGMYKTVKTIGVENIHKNLSLEASINRMLNAGEIDREQADFYKYQARRSVDFFYQKALKIDSESVYLPETPDQKLLGPANNDSQE